VCTFHTFLSRRASLRERCSKASPPGLSSLPGDAGFFPAGLTRCIPPPRLFCCHFLLFPAGPGFCACTSQSPSLRLMVGGLLQLVFLMRGARGSFSTGPSLLPPLFREVLYSRSQEECMPSIFLASQRGGVLFSSSYAGTTGSPRTFVLSFRFSTVALVFPNGKLRCLCCLFVLFRGRIFLQFVRGLSGSIGNHFCCSFFHCTSFFEIFLSVSCVRVSPAVVVLTGLGSLPVWGGVFVLPFLALPGRLL